MRSVATATTGTPAKRASFVVVCPATCIVSTTTSTSGSLPCRRLSRARAPRAGRRGRAGGANLAVTCTLWGTPPPFPPPSRTNWTRLVPPSVLIGHVSWL